MKMGIPMSSAMLKIYQGIQNRLGIVQNLSFAPPAGFNKVQTSAACAVDS